MPTPWARRHAIRDFRAFVDDPKERARLVSDNSAYTFVDAVLQIYCKRLTAGQALLFCQCPARRLVVDLCA